MARCVAVVVVAFVMCGVFQMSAFAEEKAFDPLERNLIFVEGDAEATAPTNMFKLSFDFDVQRGSFAEASAESERIISEISDTVARLKLPQFEIIKGWDFIKQATISIGQSGKKLSNRLTIKVTNFPEGKLHELVARIIDDCLAINKDIYFKQIEAGVSEDIEKEKREEVLMAALRKLKSNAERAAETQGAKVVAAKRIFIAGEEDESQERMPAYKMSYEYEEKAMTSMRKVASIQKGFAIRSQVSDHVKISAKVAGVYEIK